MQISVALSVIYLTQKLTLNVIYLTKTNAQRIHLTKTDSAISFDLF